MSPPTTQAVILAGGQGTRMRRDDGTDLSGAQRSAAAAGAKAMMPVEGAVGNAGRPFLDYVISALADAGIRETVIVVPPGHAVVRSYYSRTPPERVALRFAVQEKPRGTADALLAARDAVRDAPFLAVNADNYYSPAALRAAAGIGGCGLVAYEAGALVRESGIGEERVLRFALLDITDGGRLGAIREKPAPDDPLARAGERWVSMNLWSFTPAIFDACQRVTPSPRGELELQDAVTIAMHDLGIAFRVVRAREAVLDLSCRVDVSRVARQLVGVEVRP